MKNASKRNKKMLIIIFLVSMAVLIALGVGLGVGLSPKTYELTKIVNGVPSVSWVKNGTVLDIHPPADGDTPVGHEFDRWDGMPSSGKMPKENLTLHAIWKAKGYVLTLSVDGVVSEARVLYGVAIPLPPMPKKSGHTFLGWAELPLDGKMPAGNLTLTAGWRDVSYLTFEAIDNGTAYSITNGAATLPAVLEIPSNYMGLPVEKVGDRAFYNNTTFWSVTVPVSVTSIGLDAFSNCSGLVEIQVERQNTVYKSQGNCILTLDGRTLLLGCKSSVIPQGVETIAESAFFAFDELTSITIPDSVISIDNYAFYGCSGLTSITIPSSVTSIGEWAFADCIGLPSIMVPLSVTSIGSNAFFVYTSALEVYYEGADEAAWLSIVPDAGVELRLVHYYSAISKPGCWHYDTDGVTPVMW